MVAVKYRRGTVCGHTIFQGSLLKDSLKVLLSNDLEQCPPVEFVVVELFPVEHREVACTHRE